MDLCTPSMVEVENVECAKLKGLSRIGICPTPSRWLPLELGTLLCLLIEFNLLVFRIEKLRPGEGQRPSQSPTELASPGSFLGASPDPKWAASSSGLARWTGARADSRGKEPTD